MSKIFAAKRDFLPATFGGEGLAETLKETFQVQDAHFFTEEKQGFDEKADEEKGKIPDQLQEWHVFEDQVYAVGGCQAGFELVVAGAAGGTAGVKNL